MRTAPLPSSPPPSEPDAGLDDVGSGTTTPGSAKPEPPEGCTGRSATSSPVATLSRGEPTRIGVPGRTGNAETTPANGTGTATPALAVSTSATTWSTDTWSPTVTCHSTTSASVSPSPRSGSRKSGIGSVVPLQAGDRVEDAVDARKVGLLVHRGRVGDFETRDAQDRRLQPVEAVLREPGDDLGAVPTEPRRLVHDDRTPAPSHGRRHGGVVERRERAEVDDLDVPALLGRGLGRLEGGRDHAAVGDQGDVAAGAPDDRLVQPGPIKRKDGHLLGPVAPLRLEEDHRVLAA